MIIRTATFFKRFVLVLKWNQNTVLTVQRYHSNNNNDLRPYSYTLNNSVQRYFINFS